jgi:predicted esterase YcpF (UPF0227 family)
MLIYFHGFGSSGKGDTAKKLKKAFPSLICPSYDPNRVFQSIAELLDVVDSADDEENVIIIASSLGGWYAEKISAMRHCDLILYNPSLLPEKSLGKYGVNDNVLRDYGILTPKYNNRNMRCVILSEDDEILSASNTKELYKETKNTKFIMTNGGHRMTENNLVKINNIINILMLKQDA